MVVLVVLVVGVEVVVVGEFRRLLERGMDLS